MPRPVKPPKPTPAELDMLRLLWRLGPSTVKQAHEARVIERPDAAYASVLRLLQIMHGKGLLTRDERQRSHVYAPAHAQDSLQTNLLRDLIHKAFSGSGKDLVMAALRSHVSDEERAQIRAEIQRSFEEEEDARNKLRGHGHGGHGHGGHGHGGHGHEGHGHEGHGHD